ncbi:uncharacterized protein LOC141844451 [Curcuma longa]|uniref:uncharacterized protein LOC141844451 n=1 Tax=Curcuma longa TaxID=136217 RepID=UPI003D9F4DF3
MGSKLHQINKLFTTLRKNNCNAVNTGVKTSMERLGECHGRTSLRNTMLKHEEIFRQQVRELHRIYRVQKMLMFELTRTKPGSTQSETAKAAAVTTDTRTRNWSSTASTSDTSHSSHMSNVNFLNICSGDQSNAREKGFDLEQPAEEFTPEVELTLSIGCGKGQASSSCLKADIGPEKREVKDDSSSGFDRTRRLKSPPWLLQDLNLNKT